MPSNTPNLSLYKKNPVTDGLDTFNVVTMLNENWDKVDVHAGDAVKHLTATERTAWNAKASTAVATPSAAGLESAADKTKLDGIAPLANNYTHPANHPPSIITQDSNNRFTTDAEKVAWNAKQAALGFTPEDTLKKGASNGYPALDAASKLLIENIPVLSAANLGSGAATDAVIGNRTIDDTATPSAGPNTPTNLWSFLGNRLKNITGELSWIASPVITIRALYNKFLNSGGHGHSGVDGDGPKLNPTTALTYVPLNKAGDTATNLLLAADPTAALGAATKAYVDNSSAGVTVAPTPLNPTYGLQVVTTTKKSPFNVLNICGKTLVNRLVNAKSLTGWATNASVISLDATNFKYGSSAFKVVSTGSPFATIVNVNIANLIDITKYYIILCDVMVGEAASAGKVYIDGNGGMTGKSGNLVTNTSGFSVSYRKLQPSDFAATTVINLHGYLTPAASASGKFAYFDGFRVYEINAATYALVDVDANYTGNKLAERFPYVDGIKHVNSPYIIRYGKNLLPPFTEWTVNPVATAEPYKLTLVSAGATELSYVDVSVMANTAYNLSANLVGGAQIRLYYKCFDNNGIQLSGSAALTFAMQTITFTTPINTVRIRIEATAFSSAGTYVFISPQLELGSVATLFEPRNDDYLYFPNVAPLASNQDGTVFDQIYRQDGKWFRENRFARDVVLDGSLTWVLNGDGTGIKEVYAVDSAISNGVALNSFGSKYDGKILKSFGNTGASLAVADSYRSLSSMSLILLSIADTDSGWGESYTTMGPTELQAYFWGWKLFVQGGPYTDAATFSSGAKAWGRKLTSGSWGDIRTTLPTDNAFSYSDSLYKTPYKLTYQLAQPTFEEIAAEGSISVLEGGNQIEVGNGMIVKEKVRPVADSQSYNINNGSTSYELSLTTRRVNKFLAIYKNGRLDPQWNKNFANNITSAGSLAQLPIALFDPTATYEVTYLALDQYALTTNVQTINGEYNSNIKTVVDSLVQNSSDLETRLSIVENNKARKVQGQWIAPTLLNGWVNSGGLDSTAGYYKDEFNIVRLKGTIKSGTGISFTVLFSLPAGYRPNLRQNFALSANNTLGAAQILSNGDVLLIQGSNLSYSFDGITFLAEQ